MPDAYGREQLSGTMSSYARQRLYAPQSAETLLFLLTLTENTLPLPIRLVSDTQYHVSRSETFLPMLFSVDLPIDDGEQLQNGRINIDNIDQYMVEIVRTVIEAPTAMFEVVLASAPDDVEYGPILFQLEDAECGLQSISASAVAHPGFWNVWPQYTRTPGRNPEIYLPQT